MSLSSNDAEKASLGNKRLRKDAYQCDYRLLFAFYIVEKVPFQVTDKSAFEVNIENARFTVVFLSRR